MSEIYMQINRKENPKNKKIYLYLHKDQLLEKEFDKNISINEEIKHKTYLNKIIRRSTLKNIYSIIILFLILNGFSFKFEQVKISSFSSNITIKVKGSGMQSIFFGGDTCNKGMFTFPNEIHVNNIKQNDIKDKYNLINPINTVKLIWDNANNNCNCLFQDCINIIEIDFSKFDFSLGLSAYQMFYNCTSLISLNFHTFGGTINIHNAANMFGYCESLTSLDLSKFDISSISDTSGMFMGCHSLISLDLENFRNNYLENCQNMFYDCPSLIYVNLPNAHYCNRNSNVNNFLAGSKNIVFCTHCSKISPIIAAHTCTVNDCSNNWRQSQLKINLENNDCVSNCLSTNYKFTYQSMCHQFCPEGTYNNTIVFYEISNLYFREHITPKNSKFLS